MSERLIKIESFDNRDERCEDFEHVWPDIWARVSYGDRECLKIAPSKGHVAIMKEVLALLPEPLGALYVLADPCLGDHRAGRYQTEGFVTRQWLSEFLDRYQAFFEQDARHDVWILSPRSGAQIIYESDQLLYAYGDVDRMIPILEAAGLQEVDEVPPVGSCTFHFHPQFHALEDEILSEYSWIYFPIDHEQE